MPFCGFDVCEFDIVRQAIQSQHMYGQGRQDLLQTIAASAYVNVLLASACVTYVISKVNLNISNISNISNILTIVLTMH